MASIRQLPSGSWQASVLLDNGRRTTHTAGSAEEVAEWASQAEMKRNQEREARRDRAAEQAASVYLGAIEDYAARRLLNPSHWETLRRIVNTHDETR